MQQRSEKASRRRRLIGKAPLQKRISPKRAYDNRTSIPYGKGKDVWVCDGMRTVKVSIPYGKGKVILSIIIATTAVISIPYGKGKGGLVIEENPLSDVSIPYGKGKDY